MARKKQEIALQVELETQEEWEEMLAKEGLTIVDIYQEWCGPCKAMLSNFKRLKNELGDDLLHFAVAKADTVDALDRYRGRCEPCFLFYAGGVLVCVIRGCNAPVIMRSITEQLSHEHKVLEGNAERKEIKDPLLADLEDKEKAAEDEDEDDEEGAGVVVQKTSENAPDDMLVDIRPGGSAESVKKGVTLAILKPNVVAAGKVDEIVTQMREAGIEILEQQERTLSEEEAREFYSHKAEEEYFEDLVKFMSSGPSVVLVLTKGETGEGIIEEWRDLLGPASVEEAKETAPESLRAKYGEETYVNAVHGSDSSDRAGAELAFFFPNFSVPTLPGKGKKVKVQRTLALIRPDALKERKDEIMAKIEESGFKVAMQKEIQLSREQAEEFYKEHRDQPYFEELVTRMTCGPLLALALAREDAIDRWRDLLGPTEVEKAKEEAPQSLRAQFSVDETQINQLHGSDTTESAQKEISYFFPMQQTVAAIKPDAYQTKDEIMARVREAGFHIAARKETELTKDIAEQFYKDHMDKEYFGDLTEHMTSGPTLFMVLSREDAVDGWRSMMGPTDPSKAKEEAPDSLRAQFGTDLRANAIHGSSNPEHAKEHMKLVFGELEFNPDGTVKGDTIDQEADSDDKAEKDDAAPEDGEGDVEQQESGDQQTEQAAEGEGQKEETTEDQAPEGQDGDEQKDDTKPSEGETQEADTEQTTAEPEEKPAEDEQKPADEEQAPTGDEQKEEDKPQTADDKPVEGETTDDQTAEGQTTETADDQKPEGDGDKKDEEEKKEGEGEQEEKKDEDKKDGEQKEEEEQKAT